MRRKERTQISKVSTWDHPWPAWGDSRKKLDWGRSGLTRRTPGWLKLPKHFNLLLAFSNFQFFGLILERRSQIVPWATMGRLILWLVVFGRRLTTTCIFESSLVIQNNWISEQTNAQKAQTRRGDVYEETRYQKQETWNMKHEKNMNCETKEEET